jgi:hypothetical protein
MVNKKILLAMLAITLAFGMTVIGCDGGGGGGDGDQKSITITGISVAGADAGHVGIFDAKLEGVASGQGSISGGTLTVPLYIGDLYAAEGESYEPEENGGEDRSAGDKEPDREPWTGSGNYSIQLILENTKDDDFGGMYVYTDGKTWSALGITEGMDMEQILAKLPKYSISASNSITFSKFQEVKEWMMVGPEENGH